MEAKTSKDYNVGDTISFSKTITEFDVYTFAGVTGDLNPIHINSEYAKTTQFGQRIAHGILSVGFISNLLGANPPGAVYMSQTCRFTKPVFIGDTVTATIELLSKDEVKKRVVWRTYCTNQKGEITLDGEAQLMYLV